MRDAHDYAAMSTRNLMKEAEYLLFGQTQRTEEAELALALLDRLDDTLDDLDDLDDARAHIEDN